MLTKPLQHRRTRQCRQGFTLLELLIVIMIIGILLAILVPAISNVRTNARVAQVRTEINGLEGALNDFKVKFGDYPPSRITLYHNAAAWGNTSNSEVLRSRAIIRRFWPQFNFNSTAAYPWSATTELRGAECLVFFLGGVCNTSDSTALIGFSNNPATPFDQTTTSRTGPFFEFDGGANGRLITSITSGGYNFQAYRDPLPNQTQPYIYASSYDGQGYEAADVQASAAMAAGQTRLTNSAYLQTAGGTALKNKSFQIISPGFDQQFGLGGVWNESTADSLLVNGAGGDRSVERDNITNFHTGRLANN